MHKNTALEIEVQTLIVGFGEVAKLKGSSRDSDAVQQSDKNFFQTKDLLEIMP